MAHIPFFCRHREIGNGPHIHFPVTDRHHSSFKSSAAPASTSSSPSPSLPFPPRSAATTTTYNRSPPSCAVTPTPTMKAPLQFEFPSDAASAGCITGALRRLLCATVGQDAPRDGSERAEATSVGAVDKAAQRSKPPATPCIVARLMGLDSMPVFPYTPPDMIRRSRSMNSAESWVGFMCSEWGDAATPSPLSQQRTRRPSSSFREAPASYLRQESEDFFVLNFGTEHEAERVAPNGKRGKPNTRDQSKHMRPAGVEKENVPERKPSNGKSSAIASPDEEETCKSFQIMSVQSNAWRTKQRESPAKKKAAVVASSGSKNAADRSSQDKSPVPVLGHPFVDGDYSGSISSPAPGGERKQHSSRKKLPSKFENHHHKICSDGAVSLLDEASTKKSSNREKVDVNWSRNWQEICVLAEQDVKKKSPLWASSEAWRSEEVVEIIAILAVEMLHEVLEEAVLEISDRA